MTLNQYQDLARKTAIYPDKGGNFAYTALGLNGEAGEVAEHAKKAIRDDGGVITAERREAIKRELGDVLWYVANAAAEIGISLQDVAATNLEKLFDRHRRGTLTGSGDNR